MPSNIHLQAAKGKQNHFCWYIGTNKVTRWSASYSVCVVYTKQLFTSVSLQVVDIYLPALWLGKYPQLVYTKTVDSVKPAS